MARRRPRIGMISIFDIYVPVKTLSASSEYFNELRDLIRDEGLMNAPTVLEDSDGGYQLIDGYNRLMALRSLGVTTVRVVVYPA